MDEDFRKHLDLIQGVVNRLAGNSFSIKTWAIGLVTVLGSLAAKDGDPRMSCALILPAIAFWSLDAYYLRQEQLYRKLYQKVLKNDPGAPRYSLDASKFDAEVDRLGKVALSPTVCWLHLPILVLVIGLIAYAFSVPRPSVKSLPPTTHQLGGATEAPK